MPACNCDEPCVALRPAAFGAPATRQPKCDFERRYVIVQPCHQSFRYVSRAIVAVFCQHQHGAADSRNAVQDGGDGSWHRLAGAYAARRRPTRGTPMAPGDVQLRRVLEICSGR